MKIAMIISQPDINGVLSYAKDLNDQYVINTFVWMIEELSKSVGVTQKVSDVGCKEEDLEMLADKAMEDPCKPGNRREVSREDFINWRKWKWKK